MLARHEEEYPLSIPQPGWAEQDPEDWWRATERALDAVGREGPVGLTGQMHGLVLLDATDRVLRPAILWNDQRTGAECAEIEERVGFERLVALTGNRALPGFTAPKLVWVRKHEPDVWAKAAHVLLPKDYVRLRLTGERAIDAAEASGTLLFDVAGRRWSDEVCDALEVPSGVAAHSRRVDRDRRRRRPAGRRTRRRRGRARAAVGRARHVGRRVRRAPGLPGRPGGARPRLLPRGPGHLGGDGRDALGGGLAEVAAGRRRRRRTTSWSPRPRAGRPGRRGLPSCPTSRASARRMRTRPPGPCSRDCH